MWEFPRNNLALKLILNVSLLKAFFQFSPEEHEITLSPQLCKIKMRMHRKCIKIVLEHSWPSFVFTSISLQSYFKASDSDFIWGRLANVLIISMLVATDSLFATILDLAGPCCFPLSQLYALCIYFNIKCEWLRDQVIPTFSLAGMFTIC